jgi:hypothetical protein
MERQRAEMDLAINDLKAQMALADEMLAHRAAQRDAAE